jgi:hypothetical protein
MRQAGANQRGAIGETAVSLALQQLGWGVVNILTEHDLRRRVQQAGDAAVEAVESGRCRDRCDGSAPTPTFANCTADRPEHMARTMIAFAAGSWRDRESESGTEGSRGYEL